MEKTLSKFTYAAIAVNDPLHGDTYSLAYCLITYVISRMSACLLRQTNIAMHFFLHSMPELRSFPRYRGILRVSEKTDEQFQEAKKVSVNLIDLTMFLQFVKLPNKFPFLGIKLVHYWILCGLKNVFSFNLAAKDFVQKIISFSKKQRLTTFIPLKMNCIMGNLKPLFSNHYFALFIININNKNKKHKGISRNNYCPIKRRLFILKYNLLQI